MSSTTPRMSLILAVAVACAAACASGGSFPSRTGTSTSGPARRDATVITADELTDPALRSLSVFDAIRTLRPNFLSSRGTQTIPFKGNNGVVDEESGMVHASIDDSGVLPLDNLKRLQVSGVVEVRLLSPAAAMQRFGATAKQGPVISVRTM